MIAPLSTPAEASLLPLSLGAVTYTYALTCSFKTRHWLCLKLVCKLSEVVSAHLHPQNPSRGWGEMERGLVHKGC